MEINLPSSTSVLSISSESINFPIKVEASNSPHGDHPQSSTSYNFSQSTSALLDSDQIKKQVSQNHHSLSGMIEKESDPSDIPYPNFGKANITLGPNFFKHILFESKTHSGHVFRFAFHRNTSIGDQYRCSECFKIYKRKDCFYKLKKILVKNGYFLTNPDEPDHPHFCMDNNDDFKIIEFNSSSSDIDQQENFKVIKKELQRKEVRINNIPTVHTYSDVENTQTEDQKPSSSHEHHLPCIPKKKQPRIPKKTAELLADYGGAILEENSDGKICLFYTDSKNNSQCFHFIQVRPNKGAKTLYFICKACKIVSDAYKIPFNFEEIKVQGGRIMTDPDIPHICVTYTQEEINQSLAHMKRPVKRSSSKSYISMDEPVEKKTKMTTIEVVKKEPKSPAYGVVKPMIKRTNGNSSSQQNPDLKETDSFIYIVDVHDFDEDEVQVEIEKDYIIIQAEKIQEVNEDEEVKKAISYKKRLPENIDKDSIKGDFDEKGKLIISGKIRSIKEEKRSIPIGKIKSCVLPPFSS